MNGNGVNKDEVRALLQERRFGVLFRKLGWDGDRLEDPLQLQVSNNDFTVTPVAEKRDFVAFVCEDGDNLLATKADRKKLTSQLARYHYEHLLIIHGEHSQRWMLAIRPQDRPVQLLEAEWHSRQDIGLLSNQLHGLFFHISDEDGLTITDVVEKVRGAFMQNAEKVTRKFYKTFKKELQNFADFIEGIDRHVREWYAALMLNRLMFIYFLQKRGFLDGKRDYLKDKLAETKETYGADKFDRMFYRRFLRRLFAEGLGAPEDKRAPELQKMIGKVPYLNGGLFDLHSIERDNKDIEIPDRAFANLFKFFDKYNWHLDTRPAAKGDEINPDVIGYIFERYINKRAEMGAYYTQEDVTGYIARNTIIPFLLERARKECASAFEPQNGIWRFLREKPEDFIYDAVKKGCDIPDSELPDNIRRGLDAAAANLLDRRKDWNKPADNRFALPTETWRETISRRIRYHELFSKLKSGGICSVEDLITHNLDIERFAAVALESYNGAECAEFVDAFFTAIVGKAPRNSTEKGQRGITVLDPACGSGAFLFAALNVLEPLYQQCLGRMDAIVAEYDLLRKKGKHKGPAKYQQFRKMVKDIDDHPNERYWIYRQIILHNLFGVDMMHEAAEIAKLRLFLKLAAAAGNADLKKPNLGLEPLPDIDYNIRHGNSLVGFAGNQQFDSFIGSKSGLLDAKEVDSVRGQMEMVARADIRFRESQDNTPDNYKKAKENLRKELQELNTHLNRYLFIQYGESAGDRDSWMETHAPFHWLADFYDIVENSGGFDVVIGNPPYVECKKKKVEYGILDYSTAKCGNLFAFFLERGVSLCSGRSGWIIPISWASTQNMNPARDVLSSVYPTMHISNYADRPSSLFNGVHQKLSIVLCGKAHKGIYTTGFSHWYSPTKGGQPHEKGGRPHLFNTLAYHPTKWEGGIVRKFGCAMEESILRKIQAKNPPLRAYFTKKATTAAPFHLNMRLMMWVKCFLAPKRSKECQTYYPVRDALAPELSGILNSNLFFWHWQTRGDCWHLIQEDMQGFCVNLAQLSDDDRAELSEIAITLEDDLEANKKFVDTAQTDYEYYHRKSKHIIDKIDTVLAKHYGLTDEELDYIINYDIKYRTGQN